MVSTVGKSYFDKYLSKDYNIHPLGELLQIEGAGGHKLPYLGFIETEICVPGTCTDTAISCLLLVVPDTSYHNRVPVLLGTNTLATVTQLLEHTYGVRYMQKASINTCWHLALRCLNMRAKAISRSDGRLCVIKSAKSSNVTLPSNTTITIDGIIDKKIDATNCLGVMQQIDDSKLSSDVEIMPLLVRYDDQLQVVKVCMVNHTSSTLVISPSAIICQLQMCDVVDDDDSFFSDLNESEPRSVLDNIDWNGTTLKDEELTKVKYFISKWTDIFSSSDTDIGLTSMVKHRIDLYDPTPFKQRHRRIPPSLYPEVRKHLKDLLDADIIRPSFSPWCSNIVLVRKKDKSLRMCLDFRQLNDKTIKDSYSLPRIEELLEGLAGNRYFTVLDLKSGYHQLEVYEPHRERTAFTVGPLGFYEYNRLAFGLSNAPATYQRFMSECLGPLNHTICEVFLDDVIIFSSTLEEHLIRLEQVFQRFRECNLKLSAKKCHFMKDSVRYVGHIVSRDGISADPDKLDKILTWPEPTNVSELRTYLGFAGYYRRFIKNFSTIARPLNDLLAGKVCTTKRKGKHTVPPNTSSWIWGESQRNAFNKLKVCFTKPPILAYPDFTKEFVVHTDACSDGLGSVLYQNIDGKDRVICYASRGLNKAERNYSAHKLEFLCLKWAITQKFSDYLYGNFFTVYTDNNPLTYVLSTARLDATGQRWVSELASYNFTIKYRSGRENRDADALSRLPGQYKQIDHEVLKSVCNNIQPAPYVETLSMSINVMDNDETIESTDLDVLNPQEWRVRQRQDPVIGDFLRFVTQKVRPDPKAITSIEGKCLMKEYSHLIVRRGVLYRKIIYQGEERFQLVLPKNWRNDALRGVHDEVGHFGRARGNSLLRDRFYWPQMCTDLDNWINKCERCILRKSRTATAPLVSIHTTQPLEVLCMDFLSLETSKGGYQYILVITDHFTRYAAAIPTKNMTAKTTATALFNEFITHYGFPMKIHSDQGGCFESKLMKELCELSGMAKSRTTPYHAAGNGTTERWNKTLLDMLGTLDPDQKTDWKSHIGPLVHAYNSTKHESTNISPYYLMFGRQPRLAIDVVLGLAQPGDAETNYSKYIEDLKKKLTSAYKLADEKSRVAKARQKKYFDRKSHCAVVKTGDRVLVKIVAFEGRHKISDRWERDPYNVLSQPNIEIPVFKVQREDGVGPVRTLHRNLLLPIGNLPIGQGKVTDKPRAASTSTAGNNAKGISDIKIPKSSEVTEIFKGGSKTNVSSTSDSGSDSDLGFVHQPNVHLESPDNDSVHEASDEARESISNTVSDASDVSSDAGQDLSDEGDTIAAQNQTPPLQSPPRQPQVRRSNRNRKPPERFRTGEFVMSQTEPEWAQRAKFLQSLMSVNQDKNGEIFKTLLKVISK